MDGWKENHCMGQYEYWHKKKILRKKKGGVWCSLHRCTRKLIDSQWKGIRVERRNRSKDFSLARGIVFLKENCFFDGKIPFPPHFPSKSGTCTNDAIAHEENHLAFTILCLYFLWHVAWCHLSRGRERYFPNLVFPFHHLLLHPTHP